MHNEDDGVEFDPVKAEQNLAKHQVSFAHAEQALRDPFALTIDDPDSVGEARFITMGADALGRILVVIHTQRALRTRLISARKAGRSERRRYHAQGI
jgi:uncharacterized DUF497 family protein